ncbi:hypothetical protein M2325_000689 [Methanococcus voltae PS]|uniref:MarR family transcriptional regulator n=1 Tax=Methanococcus voltae PS TaxID=523842 RepID=A0ABT2EVM0_METVO|nr:hypothetical protein [Methanococcus voltae]MCS3922004.1 hypothetical protein [Methanococcus voltae PS]
MATQEEILQLIIDNGGVISTAELNKLEGYKSNNQRLQQLIKKKIISKVKGPNKSMIYFLIDLEYINKETKEANFIVLNLNEDLSNYKKLLKFFELKADSKAVKKIKSVL